MKNKITILLIIAAFSILTANATVWRVNNNPGIDADFTNFTTAQNMASANDTLYFEGSTVSYGNIAITKPLIIIGPGYFLTENPQTQANLNNATFGTITFNTGSSFSKIMGLVITGTITINVGNIEIIKNKLQDITFKSTTSFSNIYIGDNYVSSEGAISNSSGSEIINNIVISNNFFYGYYGGIGLPNNFYCVISNNIFNNSNINVFNSTLINNIQPSGAQTLNNNVYFNNIGNGTQFPNNNNNQQNVNMNNVFVGATGYSTDGQWQLKAGSPAIGAGNDGTDCGIFGGLTPYVLSGMPSIPAIYEINMPASGNNVSGINVTVKAKSH